MRLSPRSAAPYVLLAALAATGVALTRPIVFKAVAQVKARDDVYTLPPPKYLKAMALGYDAATVDQIWSKLRVDYGTHWQDNRAFPDVPRYFDAIVELEPTYATLYEYADTLMVYRPPVGTEEDARLARHYLELGTQHRPFDHKVWTRYGEFLAFTAASFLTSRDEINQWKREGALAMVHAIDLGASPDRSRSAAMLLNKNGERDAAIRALTRAYNITRDEEEQKKIAARLREVDADLALRLAEEDKDFLVRRRFERAFLPYAEFLLLLPTIDVPRCTGWSTSWYEKETLNAGDEARECARGWDPRLPSSR